MNVPRFSYPGVTWFRNWKSHVISSISEALTYCRFCASRYVILLYVSVSANVVSLLKSPLRTSDSMYFHEFRSQCLSSRARYFRKIVIECMHFVARIASAYNMKETSNALFQMLLAVRVFVRAPLKSVQDFVIHSLLLVSVIDFTFSYFMYNCNA
jgi:hypothetical protein